MSILDASIMVGLESTYGTPVTLSHAFEGKADTFKREQSRLESVGFRPDMQALRNDRVVTVNMGGAGSIELDLLNKGHGLLFGGSLGTKAGPTQVSATVAYLQTYATSDAAPADSFTIQVVRPKLESGTQQFTYHGCKITGWTLGQSPDGLCVVNYDFDFEDSDITTSEGTEAYPSAATPYDWTDCVVTLDPDGSPETLDLLDLSFSADLALKTDRRYLSGSALKKEPVRNGMPSYTGEMKIDFTGTERYAEWTAETALDIQIKWTGATIASGQTDFMMMRMKACDWTGGNPEVSLSETPMQTLPFQAMHNGTDAALTLTYQNIETAA